MSKLLIGAAALCATAIAGSAGAATLAYSADFTGSTYGPEWTVNAQQYFQSPDVLGRASSSNGTSPNFLLTLSSPGDSTSSLNGTLVFDLQGYSTIDGCCDQTYGDTFSLAINGVNVFQALFGFQYGSDSVTTNLGNATSYIVSGSKRTITTNFTAVQGANTFRFGYSPLQGYDDESFSIDNVSISAAVNDAPGGAVPEPTSWALMIGGFGLAGGALRRRKVTPASA